MGRQKALLLYHGKSFLENCIAALQAWCSPVYVVVGYQAEAVRDSLPDARVSWLVNADYERGQFSSLQTAAREFAGARRYDAAVVAPVDHPAFQPSTVEALIAAFASSPSKAIVKPVYRGRSGHPVLYSTECFGIISSADAGSTARDIQSRLRNRSLFVEVDDPGVLLNVDTPEDYRRLTASLPPPVD